MLERHGQYMTAVLGKLQRPVGILCTWARQDMDLWHTVFTGCQHRPYCKHCFGFTHSADHYCATLMPALSGTTATFQPQKPRICREWNYSQCSFLGCRYIHAYLACYTDPNSADSNHKWIQCHQNPKECLGPPPPPQRGLPPLIGMPRFPPLNTLPMWTITLEQS